MKNPKMFIKLTTLSIILCLIVKSNLVSSQTTLVAPINKDTTTSLFTITFPGNDRYVVDISAIYSWKRCHHPPPPPYVAYLSFLCTQAHYLIGTYCIQRPITGTSICFLTPPNPVTETCVPGVLTSTNLMVSWTDGATATAMIYISCAPESHFQSLPPGVVGLASLGDSQYFSLHSQFPNTFPDVKRKFAMCLPRTGSVGTVFFGDGPYNPDTQTDFDASTTTLVTYVKLFSSGSGITPYRNANYYIRPNALSVYGNLISVPNVIFMTTAVPYMTLRSDVYNQFLELFEEEMKGVPQVEKVEQFNVCYNTTGIAHDGVGLDVPKIGLEFDEGTWTIYGSNSMKYVGDDVACLAILDGGEKPRESVVMGSFQMEDYLLVFDQTGGSSQKFGFSSSLPLLEGLSCGNFSLGTDV